MLKNIPKIVSPQLLKVLCELGHGDEIVLADGNFPPESMGKDAIVVRADGHGVAELLDAVLSLMPLDQYAEQPAALMEAVPGDPCVPVIWDEYKALLDAHGEDSQRIQMLERFAFYERAKKAYAVVATGETAIYANILLKEGLFQVAEKQLSVPLISELPAAEPSKRCTTVRRFLTKRCTVLRIAHGKRTDACAGTFPH